MFKLYKKSYDAQMLWIRQNPGKYIALNAILLAGFFLYMEYEDRKFDKEIENARNQHNL